MRLVAAAESSCLESIQAVRVAAAVQRAVFRAGDLPAVQSRALKDLVILHAFFLDAFGAIPFTLRDLVQLGVKTERVVF